MEMKKKTKMLLFGTTGVAVILWMVASLLQFQDTKVGEDITTDDTTSSDITSEERSYIPPDAEILSSSNTKEGTQITLKSAMTISELSKFYQGILIELGWEVGGTSENEGFLVLTFTKPGRSLEVSLTEDPGEGSTIVGLHY